MTSKTVNRGFKKSIAELISMRRPVDPQEFLRHLGQAIRSARKQMNLTLEELGELADVNPKYLGEVELGRSNPSVVILLRIAKALELEPADLLLASQHSLGGDLKLYKKLVELLRNLDHPEVERLRKVMKMIFE